MRQTPAHPGKRHLIGAAMALVAATWLPGANAQTANWPNRPIKLVVPYGPGSSPDVIARIVGEKLSARLGQPVVVENRAGAGGNTSAPSATAPVQCSPSFRVHPRNTAGKTKVTTHTTQLVQQQHRR